MSQEPQEFFLPIGITAAELVQALAPVGSLRFGPPEEVDWCFFDTFDWRLGRRNLVLEERRAGECTRVGWRTLQTGRLLGEQSGPLPRFVAELPPSPLRRVLEPLVEQRALLPRVAGHSRQEGGLWLNGEQKTVARVRLETPQLKVAGRGGLVTLLPRRLSVLAVRGYSRAARELGAGLLAIPGVTPAGGDLLSDALEAAGLTASALSGKSELHLTRELPAHLAVRQILLRLLEAMENNREGAAAGWDTEFLHDFRVAVRRSRTALGQLRGLFQPPELAHFRSEFSWLGSVTGPVRDLDVHLLEFPSYHASLPEAYRQDLAPLQTFLRQRHRAAQKELARALSSRRYQTLVRDWKRLLRDPSPGVPTQENALAPIFGVASGRIGKLLLRVLKKGRKIDPSSPAPALHELRITCKKLRYLLEFFAEIYPPKYVGRLIRELKALQDYLGTFQDLSVQGQALSHLAEEMAGSEQGPVPTLLAMGMLVENLERRREDLRQDFSAHFTRFARKGNRALDQLFEGHHPQEDADQ